jgi:outer membrane protein
MLPAAFLIAARPAAAEPLDLASCVRRALTEGPSVLDAVDLRDTAAVERQVVIAERSLQAIPTLSGGFQGDNRTDQRYQLLMRRRLFDSGTELEVSGGTSVFSSVPEVTVPYFTEARVALSQPLLRGRTTLENRDRLDQVERRIAAAGNALAQAREDLALEVVRRYYEVLRARQLLAVADASIKRVDELAAIAEAKLELGSASKMDVYRAELHAARLRDARLEHDARRTATLDELKGLLGIAPEIPLELDARVQGPTAAADEETQWIDRALARRPEVVEAREQVLDGERRLLVARHGLWPELDFVGVYARQGLGASFEGSTRLDREEWGVGLRSTTPLDRTADYAAVSVAEIELRARERKWRIVRDTVGREVREALRRVARAAAETALDAEVAARSSEQAELARLRYDKGVTDNFDAVQAEIQNAEAQGSVALATIEQAVAAAELHRAAGTLVERFVEIPEASQ